MNREEDRFSFGANWARFLRVLNDERIGEAETSLRAMLGLASLEGLSFLDIGSGSGLFSLAAARLGATKIYSFDYDWEAVACTQELKKRFFPQHTAWIIEQGSVLDNSYMSQVGGFDIVYSWGVLHHTGSMWQAMENVIPAVKRGGRLFLSIYNDQGLLSQVWYVIKRKYNQIPPRLRWLNAALIWLPIEIGWMSLDLCRGRVPWSHWSVSKKSRGMSYWHDVLDWIGGYPYEVAKPDTVFRFYKDRGFILEEMVLRQGNGCNEFVFRRAQE